MPRRYNIHGAASPSGRVPHSRTTATRIHTTTPIERYNRYGGIGAAIPLASSWRDPKLLERVSSPDSGFSSPTRGLGSGADANTILEVASIDFEALINAKDHHTDKYDCVIEESRPIYRRGQKCRWTINTRRPHVPHKDCIFIKMEFGPSPTSSKGTRVVFPLADKDAKLTNDLWSAKLHRSSGTHVIIDVMVPVDCPVGNWTVTILTNFKDDDKKIQTFTAEQPVCVLFNAWCKEDPVYLEDEAEREEYILNDVGKIWCGTAKRLRYRTWNYGQFEDKVFDAAVAVLDKSKMEPCSRGNPILTVRTISAMVNSPDDLGILEGNWSGNYEGGTPPTQWQGSVQILTKWYETGEPVLFGQCWVFSGVTTTVLRALGIPGRSVTNFASAHDTNSNVTVDYHYNDKFEKMEDMNYDSIWNFHVWNECWMARKDLPKGYGGWQAIDATPQEASDGVYRAGPASVLAVKRGEVGFMYDAPFIFAEVNADIIHWLYKGSIDDVVKLEVDHGGVGKMISTKRPGKHNFGTMDRLDVTEDYKHPDMSDEERATVLNALTRSHSYSLQAYSCDKKDILFDLQDRDDVYIGKPFSIYLKMVNTSTEKRSIDVTLHLDTTFYTGVIAEKVKTQKYSVILKAKGEAEANIHVTAEEYLDLIVDQAAFQISAIAKVKETNQVFCNTDDFRVRAPDVTIKASPPFKVGKPFKIDCKFTNPLQRTLHHCYFIVEGPGVEKPHEIQCSNVAAKGDATMSYTLTPKKEGEKTVLVSFTSKELADADGALVIEVTK